MSLKKRTANLKPANAREHIGKTSQAIYPRRSPRSGSRWRATGSQGPATLRTLHVTLGSDIYVAMKTTTQSFDVRTPSRDAMIDITSKVQAVVSEAGVDDGVAAVYVPHTTAGVTINENADPDVIHDVLAALDHAVPWRQNFYQHGEGNSAAHAKSSMVGCNTSVPIRGGRLSLGTWQGVFFCEFDGPRTRHVVVTVMG